jgi:hypothetical protein
MTVTGSPPSDEAVLVGSTRAEAAEVFGTLCDHAFLTSYDDFDEEIDASRIPALGLVAGEALEEVLTRIMVLPNGPGGQRPAVVIGLSADLHQLGSVERALTTQPSIAVAEVVSDHHRVLLYVEPADQVSPAAATEVADALDALRRASRVGGPRSPKGSGHDAPAQGTAPRPEDERPVQPRSRRDRLVRLAAVALAAAVVVGVFGALVGGFLGTTALLVLVLVAVVVGLAAVVAIQWRLLTELRGVRREQEQTWGDQTTHLLELARANKRAQEQQTATSKTVAEDVTATGNRVLALGRLLARQGMTSRQPPAPSAPPSDPSA